MIVDPAQGFLVRPAEPGDLAATAALHVTHLPHGLFPSLGTRFVRAWHGSFLTSSHAVAYVATVPEGDTWRVVGFVLGSGDQHAFMADTLARERVRLAVAGATGLLARPRVLVRFVTTRLPLYVRRLLRRDGRAAVPSPAPHGPVAVLTALVVAPQARGTGVGAALVDRFARAAWARGARQADLVTRAGPTGAGAFYAGLGWTRVGTHPSRDGDPVDTYRLLPGPAAPAPPVVDPRTEPSTRQESA